LEPAEEQPVKRIEQLQQLSREHHQALVLANRCQKTAATADPDACNTQWQWVRKQFIATLMPHFRIEEQTLIEPLIRLNNIALLDQLLHQHGLLQACVFDNSEPAAKRLQHFGKLLSDHVRFEERQLFPYLEQHLNAEELSRIDVVSTTAALDHAPVHSDQPAD
jgi:hemerythrin-like domain-containing protein